MCIFGVYSHSINFLVKKNVRWPNGYKRVPMKYKFALWKFRISDVHWSVSLLLAQSVIFCVVFCRPNNCGLACTRWPNFLQAFPTGLLSLSFFSDFLVFVQLIVFHRPKKRDQHFLVSVISFQGKRASLQLESCIKFDHPHKVLQQIIQPGKKTWLSWPLYIYIHVRISSFSLQCVLKITVNY